MPPSSPAARTHSVTTAAASRSITIIVGERDMAKSPQLGSKKASSNPTVEHSHTEEDLASCTVLV
jgi:hypothetical protein